MIYDIKGTLTWALRERLKTDSIYQMEIGTATWYLDNYTARAVPTACAYVKLETAPEGITRKLTRRVIEYQETLLTDTGTRKNNEKHLVCVFRAEDGTEVGVRDDHAKLLGKTGRLYGVQDGTADGLLVVRGSDGTPGAIFPPVRIPT